MKYSKVIGTGSYLPEKIMTNYDFEKLVDTSHDWIVARTGIHQRHIASLDETPSSMAEIASRRAIEMAAIDVHEIDLIVVATSTPESFFPSTACLLQNRIGAKTCIAFDVSAACSGFIYAMNIVDQYIRNGVAKCALVVGSEIMSSVIDWKDRNTCVLFGDGAGAVVVKADEKPGVIASKLFADGSKRDLLYLPSALYDSVGPLPHIQMKGRELFKVAVDSMVMSVRSLLADTNIGLSEVDWIVPHQANSRILDLIIQKLGFPKEKVVVTVAQHANTSGASIPLAFDYAVREGMIKSGQKVLFEAFGGGLTWGSLLMEY